MAAGDATRTLLARFATDTSDLDRAQRKLGAQGRGMGDQLSRGFEQGASRLRRIATTVLGFAVVRGAFNAIKGALAGIGEEAREAQRVGGQTEAVIKSMGASSWASASQVEALSEALSRQRGVDDELIQSGANVLLTFKNLQNAAGRGNDIFNQATAITHDMSVALGKDMTSSALLVGKALNDPIKGITALGRSGIQFTQQQKDQIKAMVESGNTMGAQKLILAELNAQFAGSAEAQATFGDKWRVMVDNIRESIGQRLMPIADRFFKFMIETGLPAILAVSAVIAAKLQPHLERFGRWLQGTGLPALKAFGQWLLANVVPVVLDLADSFRVHVVPILMQFGAFLVNTVIPALASAVGWMQQNSTLVKTLAVGVLAGVLAWKAWTTAIATWTAITKGATAAQAALNAVMRANPIGIVITIVFALAAAFAYAWKNSETFRNIVIAAWNGIKAAASAVWSFIRDYVVTPYMAYLGFLWDRAVDVKNGVVFAFNLMRDGLGAAWNWLRDNAINPISNGFQDIWDKAVAVKDGVVRTFQGMRDSVGTAFGELKGRILAPIASVIRWINSNLIGNINKVTTHFNLEIPSIPVPKYHTGGVVRGRPGSEQPAILKAGEGVIPEGDMGALARLLGTSKRGTLDILKRLAASGRTSQPGLAQGGPFDWVSDAAGAVSGAVASIGSQIGDWLKSGAAFAMDKIMSPIVSSVGGVMSRAGGSDFLADLMTGIMRKLKDAAVRWARGKDSIEADTVRGIGALAGKPVASGWSKPIGPGYRIGRGSKGHGYLAQDLPAPTGTPIYAMHDGRVIRAQDLTTSYGRHLFIAHPGTTGVYAHMSQRAVGLNAYVRSGQLIGRVGSTGNSTGPHLHLETRGFDPLAFLRARGIRFDHGGELAPGLNVVDNRTGKPEQLINRDDLPVFHVHVYIGDREITDIVRVEVRNEKRNDANDLYGAGVHVG